MTLWDRIRRKLEDVLPSTSTPTSHDTPEPGGYEKGTNGRGGTGEETVPGAIKERRRRRQETMVRSDVPTPKAPRIEKSISEQQLVVQLARRYWEELTPEERELERRILDRHYERGYLTKQELRDIWTWKNSRFAPLIRNQFERNTESEIQRVTARALASSSSEEALTELTKLSGVGFRTATAVLHVAYSDPMRVNPNAIPILDINVLTALGVDRNKAEAGDESLDRRLWPEYHRFLAMKALQLHVPMRVLDRALFCGGKHRMRAWDVFPN